MKPYSSAFLICKAVHLNCPNGLNCLFCEHLDFCKAMLKAYEEAKKILPEELISAIKEDQIQKNIINSGTDIKEGNSLCIT